ncbi:MAG TPA: hypothetical protein VGE63_01125 [Candidatus Paceibacterota bacterium]
MTEVYRTNEEGMATQTIGVFKNPTVAAAFAGNQSDSNYIKTNQVLVLTDGTTCYLFKDVRSVKLFNDEDEALAAKEKALAKLSPEDRALLGLT